MVDVIVFYSYYPKQNLNLGINNISIRMMNTYFSVKFRKAFAKIQYQPKWFKKLIKRKSDFKSKVKGD